MDLPYSQGFAGWVVSRFGREATNSLDCFAADLHRFNRAQNLVSRSEPEQRIAALVEECSLALSGVLERGYGGGRWVDVGSGGGIPGLVWAALQPEQRIDLVERRRGRCDFLRREVGLLSMGAVSVIEDSVGDSPLEPIYSLATAKAVSPAPEIFEILGPLLATEGRILLFQRESWSSALAPKDWVLEDQWSLVLDGPRIDGPVAFLFQRSGSA